jgi:PKD domain
MPDAAPPASQPSFVTKWIKIGLGGFAAMCTGAVGMYANVVFDKVVKPSKPVANFAVAGTDGLTVTFDNKATGESGWWDFGDGTVLEPFDPAQPTVTHTYPKTGGFSAKLVVRNFLMEEADRSIGVDLSNPPNLLPPTLTGLTVEPLREVIPATYRITGQLANADEVVWKYGDKAEHVPAPTGAFEKFVTIDKPGPQPIMLTALSKTRKEPQVFVQTVSVTAPKQAVYDAEVTIADTTTDTKKSDRPMRTMVPVMMKGAPTKGVDRTDTSTPGWTIAEVKLDPKAVPTVKNLKAEVSADRRSVRLTGEWADTADKVMKASRGGDVIIPYTLVEEKTATTPPRKQVSSNVMDASGNLIVRLPQQAAKATRTISVDFGISGPTGRRSLMTGTLDASGNWSAPLDINGKPHVVKANSSNGTVRVVFAEAGK